MKWYVYLWLREDRTPYYVGKGQGYRKRIKHYHKNHYINPPPLDRIVVVKYFEEEAESYTFEEWLIQVYGRKTEGGILINQSIGGRNRCSLVRSEEERGRRRKETMKKYKSSEKYRETMRKYNEREEVREKRRVTRKKYRDKNREELNRKAKERRKRKKEGQSMV